MIPYKTGALTRRVGTKYIATVKNVHQSAMDDAGVNLIKFIFSPETEFVLEFGNFYVRFYSNGQQVNLNTAPLWVSLTPYVQGDFVTDPTTLLIYYNKSDVTSATQPHSDPSHWDQQTIYEVPTPYGSITAPDQSVFDGEVFFIVPCQINDVIYLVHPRVAPYKLTRFTDTDWKMEPANFITPPLLDQNVTDTTIAASATTGAGVALVATAPAWGAATYYSLGNSVLQGGVIYNCIVPHVSAVFATELAAGYWEAVTVFIASQIGSTWQLGYIPAVTFVELVGVAATGLPNGTSAVLEVLGAWEVHTYGVWSNDIAIQQSTDQGTTWSTVRTFTSRGDANADISGTAVVTSKYRIVVSNTAVPPVPGTIPPRVVFQRIDAFLYGLVKITAVGGPYAATATVVTKLNSTAATQYWSEAAWSHYRGFPRAITTFQQRVIYGSSGFQPQRIWGTVTNDLENFDLGNQELATDAFAFDLNAPSRGPIQWLISQTDLFAGFSGAEWVINSGVTNATGANAGAAITATNINALEHSTWGSAPRVQPGIVGDAVLFTQRQATSLRQMQFSVYTAKYMSEDLTTLSDHLFASGIVATDYQSRWRKQGIIWAVTRQGTLCGMTYELAQEVFGWHRHQTGFGVINGVTITPDNGFESLAVIDGRGIDDDELWVVVNRNIGGVKTRYIELFNPVNWEEVFTAAPSPAGPVLADAYYVDCGKTTSTSGTRVVTGLTHLEGRYVVGLANGNAFGPLHVVSGQITLPNQFPTTIAKIQVGLPIPYSGQPMRVDLDPRQGNTQALTKQHKDIFARVWNSCGGSISNGTTGANAQPPVPLPYASDASSPIPVRTLVTTPTDLRIGPAKMPTITADPVMIVQGDDALPVTVLALIFKYENIGEA